MKVLIALILCISLTSMANAQVEQEDQDVFIKTEEQIIRDLKLLNLEVEKTKLQLKKQQMLTKLNKLTDVVEIKEPNAVTSGVCVTSVLLSTQNKVAMLTINGEHERVIEKQKLMDNSIVKEIKADGVLLEDADGKSNFIKLVKGN